MLFGLGQTLATKSQGEAEQWVRASGHTDP